MMRAHRSLTTGLATLGVMTGGLLLSAAPALAAPEKPETKPATGETGTTAILHGTLNPKVSAKAGWYFAYSAEGEGACTESGRATGQEPEVVADAALEEKEVTGLEPSRKYEFCLIATNEQGETTSGNEVPFETTGVKPTVFGGYATKVTPFAATFEEFYVSAKNQLTTCEFQYGETTAYGKEAPCEPPTFEGFYEREVGPLTVGGLEPNTTYHFRAVAKNATGTTEGPDHELTTLKLEPPGFDGESVSRITPSGATLEASINPEYQETTCEFQYGTDASLATHMTEPCPAGEDRSVTLTGLEAGKTYYYRVVAENGTPPATVGPIQSFTTQGTPLVSTGEAQNIIRTTATLSGTVNPFGAETTYYFAYIDQAGYDQALAGDAEEKANPYAKGETTASFKVTEIVEIEKYIEKLFVVVPYEGYEPRAVGPIPISGLLPDTTYHYALVAKNSVGLTIGLGQTLTTLPPTPPIVSTGGASGISQNAATLSGTVDTNSLQTEYGFEIGTEPGTYSPATGLGSLGGATTKGVSVTLGELQPGTTYYYRVTATNADGTVQGAPESFTTPGFPTLLVSPTAPPLIAYTSPGFPTGSQANTGTTETKKLTSAQKLAAALKACRRDASKKKRVTCEKRARKQFGPPAKKKRKK